MCMKTDSGGDGYRSVTLDVLKLITTTAIFHSLTAEMVGKKTNT